MITFKLRTNMFSKIDSDQISSLIYINNKK